MCACVCVQEWARSLHDQCAPMDQCGPIGRGRAQPSQSARAARAGMCVNVCVCVCVCVCVNLCVDLCVCLIGRGRAQPAQPSQSARAARAGECVCMCVRVHV